jgi:type IX secretion system PorP/SprF family membrane protein
MKTKFKIIFPLVSLFFLPLFSAAQDIHFSQFYMAPLQQNPALAGAQHESQFILNYKDQWQSIGTPYKTAAFSGDMRLNRHSKKSNMLACGINFFSDRAGEMKMGTTQANFSLAYHVRINDYSTFGGGLMAGFAQRSISSSALQWGSQYNGTIFDSSLPNGEPASSSSITYADFGCGLLYNYDNAMFSKKEVNTNHDLKINFGASLFHINQPEFSFYGTGNEKLYMKFVAHGNALISIASSNLAMVPGFMYYRQGPTQEIYAGTMVRYLIGQDSKYTGFKQGAALSLGGYLRAKDAIVATMLFEYSNYALGVSYDVNISELKTASAARGGFEISLRFVTPNPFTSQNTTTPLFK